MAIWDQVKGHLKNKYNAQEINLQGFEQLHFVLDTTESRTQTVIVQKIPFGVEMIQIMSAIGPIPPTKIDFALENAIFLPFGGIVKAAGMHFVRENLPLEDLKPDKFDMLIETISGFADQLEQSCIGGDEH